MKGVNMTMKLTAIIVLVTIATLSVAVTPVATRPRTLTPNATHHASASADGEERVKGRKLAMQSV
jgi:hypothetical protein